ncbi:MAG TPA: hypothetical protein VLA64_06170, partial [Azonexus sp.]|nr:hypothetical protein [Azonexus sp.]
DSVATHPNWVIFQKNAPSPHNFYLALWFGLGGIGLLGCLVMFFRFIQAFLAGHAAAGKGNGIFIAFLASFTAHYLIRGLFETLTWAPLSLLAGAAIATSLWVHDLAQKDLESGA